VYIGYEERRLRKGSQSERRNIGKGSRPTRRLQAGCRVGGGLGRKWRKRRNIPL
jgi:hypothetical protein